MGAERVTIVALRTFRIHGGVLRAGKRLDVSPEEAERLVSARRWARLATPEEADPSPTSPPPSPPPLVPTAESDLSIDADATTEGSPEPEPARRRRTYRRRDLVAEE